MIKQQYLRMIICNFHVSLLNVWNNFSALEMLASISINLTNWQRISNISWSTYKKSHSFIVANIGRFINKYCKFCVENLVNDMLISISIGHKTFIIIFLHFVQPTFMFFSVLKSSICWKNLRISSAIWREIFFSAINATYLIFANFPHSSNDKNDLVCLCV